MNLKKIINNDKSKYLFYILIGQVIFMIAILFINYKVENVWGSEGFATFSLIKRTAAFLVFPLVFGAGIAIPRFISFQKERLRESSVEYLAAGLFLFLCTFSLFIIGVFIFPEILIRSFKGTNFSSVDIILAIVLYIFSQGVYILIFSFYRGKLFFKYSTLLNIFIMSLIPLSLIFIAGDIIKFFTVLSLCSLTILLIILINFFYKVSINRIKVKEKVRQLFNFGNQRVVGEIALFSLDFLPVYLISIKIGLVESGYLSMSLLILKLAVMLFELGGSIILPYFGKMYSSQSKAYFINKVNKLLLFGIITAILISFIFYNSITFVIQSLFKSQITAIEATKALFFVFPIYIVYILLRNIIDIVSQFSYNSVNLIIGVVIQVSILFIGFYYNEPIIYHKFGLIIPYTIVGVLTYMTWRKLKLKI